MSFKAAISSLRARSVPLLTATALSATVYAIHSATSPARNEEALPGASASASAARKVIPLSPLSPYAPLGWGSNKYLVLSEDGTNGQVKKPSPLAQLGATPLRDLALAEKYGAAVDANGDLWMWGAGYDESGKIGRSLKGKNIRTLAPAPNKIFCLSSSGRLYALSSSRTEQASDAWKNERSWWSFLFSSSPSADFVEIKADGGLKRGERFIGASCGLHHLLVVTNKGRSFSLPVSERGNSHRQLGTRQIIQATPDPTHAASDPRFATTLSEIPSLAGIQIDQVAASSYTSFARTSTGRVLGWGANESGQIGLGPTAIVDVVPTPVEIVLARNYPGGTTLKCLDIVAGGASTMFTVERDTPGKPGTWVDLLACGNGMTGALGNGLWSSASPSPVRVKTVSGLQEYSEKANAFIPLSIYSVSLAPSPSAHVFAVLDTVREAEAGGVKQGLYGKDVMVWGGNGNGKRSSLAVPQHLPPLIPRAIADVGLSKEASISSGALSHMPHSRLQLHQSNAHAYDPTGKLLKRNVKCEEVMVAGWNASALYNKIID